MGDLPRNVREFVVRDLIYIAGGGMVLTSFLYRFDRLPDKDIPFAFYLLGAGIAYVIGNALQDIFGITRLVTTADVRRLGCLGKWFYRRFNITRWTDIQKFDPTEVGRAIRELNRKDRAYAAVYERAIAGLILASTMAPCILISSLLVWSQWWVHHDPFDFWLGVMSLPLASGLFVLARLRAAQVTRNGARAPDDLNAFGRSRISDRTRKREADPT